MRESDPAPDGDNSVAAWRTYRSACELCNKPSEWTGHAGLKGSSLQDQQRPTGIGVCSVLN